MRRADLSQLDHLEHVLKIRPEPSTSADLSDLMGAQIGQCVAILRVSRACAFLHNKFQWPFVCLRSNQSYTLPAAPAPTRPRRRAVRTNRIITITSAATQIMAPYGAPCMIPPHPTWNAHARFQPALMSWKSVAKFLLARAPSSDFKQLFATITEPLKQKRTPADDWHVCPSGIRRECDRHERWGGRRRALYYNAPHLDRKTQARTTADHVGARCATARRMRGDAAQKRRDPIASPFDLGCCAQSRAPLLIQRFPSWRARRPTWPSRSSSGTS